MRRYDVGVASLAIEAPRKWTENLLSQHRLPDVPSVRQGVARRISHASLIRLALIRQLHIGLGVGVGDAILIAEQFLDRGQSRVLEVGQLRLALDYAELLRVLNERLADALETAPASRRGRPPRKALR